jgi:hypothetical protein
MLRIVIGMINYNGVACGLAFEKSVGQKVPEEWTREHAQVRRLLALFPGTTVEVISGEEKVGTVGQDHEKVKTQLETARKIDEDAAKLFPQPGTEEEPDEQAPETEVAETVSLAAGDTVMAEYKGDICRGKIVKVLESGVVRVKLEDDEANYRVFDDDKLSRIGVEDKE